MQPGGQCGWNRMGAGEQGQMLFPGCGGPNTDKPFHDTLSSTAPEVRSDPQNARASIRRHRLASRVYVTHLVWNEKMIGQNGQ